MSELYGIPVVRIGLGLATVEDQTIELAATAVDEARAGLGLARDAAGHRMRAKRPRPRNRSPTGGRAMQIPWCT